MCLHGFAQNDYETYFVEDSVTIVMRMPGVVNSDTIRSQNGAVFPTHGVYRALTIAVNIIYDQTPDLNPEKSTEGAWPYTIVEGINNNQPNYLLELFDVENLPPFNGILTRLYAESSFNNLILLSDFMVKWECEIILSQIFFPSLFLNCCIKRYWRENYLDIIRVKCHNLIA